MELLILTLALSMLALLGQLRDSTPANTAL
jgi:hypothetical protein